MSTELTPEEHKELNAWIAANVFGLPDEYVIVKRGLYYRPDAGGYTCNLSEAWRVPHNVAKKHEYLRGDEQVTISKVLPLSYTTDAAASMALLDKCVSKNVGLCINPVFGTGYDDPGGFSVSGNETDAFGIAETLELAVAKFARKLFGNACFKCGEPSFTRICTADLSYDKVACDWHIKELEADADATLGNPGVLRNHISSSGGVARGEPSGMKGQP